MKNTKKTQAETMVDGQTNIFDFIRDDEQIPYSFQRAIGMLVEVIDPDTRRMIVEGRIIRYDKGLTVVKDELLGNLYYCNSREVRPSFSNYMNVPEE